MVGGRTKDFDLLMRNNPSRTAGEWMSAIAYIGCGKDTVVGRALTFQDVTPEQATAMDAEHAVAMARAVADELGQPIVGIEHLLIGLLRDESATVPLAASLAERLMRLSVTMAVEDYALLDRFGRDLTVPAPAPDDGDELEIERIVRVVSRIACNNVLLFGESAAETRAVVLRLAHEIAAGRFALKHLYEIDMAAVLATDSLAETLGAIGRASRNRGDVLLFIDNGDRYLRRGRLFRGADTEAAIRARIARGDIQVMTAMSDRAVTEEIRENRPIGFRMPILRIRTASDASR